MHYRLPALMLVAGLPLMPVLAAPVPNPSAILDIGPPPKGQTAEEYRKEEISHIPHMLNRVWRDCKVEYLPSVAREKDRDLWLKKNLHITPVMGGGYLRFTFRAGTYSGPRKLDHQLS